jgi:hypothetical protein
VSAVSLHPFVVMFAAAAEGGRVAGHWPSNSRTSIPMVGDTHTPAWHGVIGLSQAALDSGGPPHPRPAGAADICHATCVEKAPVAGEAAPHQPLLHGQA